MAKLLKFDHEALKALKKGIRALAKAVKVTLGPKGLNVVIQSSFGSPTSTKDGVTVAKEVVLKDKFENMAAQLLKEAATKTSDNAGDGTTTAIVLAEELFSSGAKAVTAGVNPMQIKKGIELGVQTISKELDQLATPIKTSKEVEQIATISANNDPEIGKIISEAMEKVGKDGIITVDDAKGIETTLSVVEGMNFDKGYLAPYFITNPENMTVEFENASILIVDKKLSSAKDLIPILEKVMGKTPKPFLIIAEDVDGDALATLVVNKLRGNLPLCAIKAPGFGDRRKAMLEDIATLTGATVISEDAGFSLDTVNPEEVLGRAKKIQISKEETTIVDGLGSEDALKKRISLIKSEIENTTSSYDQEKLEERLAKLVGGVAIINVGAATETELKEKKARVEDALHATRAAVAEGIVPGGGVALLRVLKSLDTLKLDGDAAIGVNIIRSAIKAPAREISNNCGKPGDLHVEKIIEGSGPFGYNGRSDQWGDLIEMGVVDPVKVTKQALQNAASISALLLTAAAMITDKPEPKSAAPAMPPGGGMGGMPGMGGMGGMPGMGGMGGMPGMGF